MWHATLYDFNYALFSNPCPIGFSSRLYNIFKYCNFFCSNFGEITQIANRFDKYQDYKGLQATGTVNTKSQYVLGDVFICDEMDILPIPVFEKD